MRGPGMLYAVIAHCPVFGGKVASFDATKAKAVPGVKNVVQISSGVAVVADSTWAAMQGRKALTIQWDEGPGANLSAPASGRCLWTRQRAGRRGAQRRRCGGGSGQGSEEASKRFTKCRIWRTRPWSR